MLCGASMKLTPEQIADCASGLIEFTATTFKHRTGGDFIINRHHVDIANTLERVVLGDITRLIINMPPRSGKTELAVKNFMAWCIGLFPKSQFIHASYSKRLASSNTYEARSIIGSDIYGQIFPHIALAQDSRAKDEFRTALGGVIYAAGSGGSITGYGAGSMGDGFGGAVIIDDPHKAAEGNSKLALQNVIDWYSNTISSRINSPETPIIVVMQRLNENDLSGWLLDGGSGEEWHHLNIPAIDERGSSFWPDQFPLQMLERLRESNQYVFAGQYMQTPSPAGGGIFKDEWWRYYDTAPMIKHRMIFADTAQKTAEQNDYSVFQCWGYGVEGQAVVLDQIRGKWEAPELLAQARAFWSKHKAVNGLGVLRSMKVEDKVSGTGLIQTLKREGVTVLPIQRNRDKVSRAYDVAPIIESGRVFLPRNAAWLSDFLHEFSAFPNGKHDDQIDPCIDALNELEYGNKSVGMVLGGGR